MRSGLDFIATLPMEIRGDVLAKAQELGNPEKLTEKQLFALVCRMHNLPYLPLQLGMADVHGYRAWGESVCEAFHVVPLYVGDTRVIIATAQPWSNTLLNDLRQELHKEIIPVGALQYEVDTVLANLKQVESLVPKEEEVVFKGTHKTATGWIISSDTDLAKTIIRDAYERGASDIHVEPQRSQLDIRYRIHGELTVRPPVEGEYKQRVLDQFKLLARMKVSDRERLKDGRISLQVTSKKVLELRVTALPTPFGEGLVLRLLDPDSIKKGMGQLPFEGKELALVKHCLSRTSGMIFVTGPTGSGKTTTLYRCLTSLDLSSQSVWTIEDPVEYTLERIQQVSINPEAEVTFPNTLRNILRADPDVIMVGEIRDEETASLAVKASLTGHLVLSTLHTSSALGVIPRLQDMGISPHLIRSTLLLVIAQRLLGKSCANCAKKITPTADMVKHFRHHQLQAPAYLLENQGCELCGFQGITGRIPIFEFLYPTPEIKDAIGHQAPERELRELCLREGYSTLAKSALQAASAGLVAYEEAALHETEFID
jgi:type IV pilus assembly protein PilB